MRVKREPNASDLIYSRKWGPDPPAHECYEISPWADSPRAKKVNHAQPTMLKTYIVIKVERINVSVLMMCMDVLGTYIVCTAYIGK